MNTLIKTTSQNVALVLLTICFLSPRFLQAENTIIKDSLLVILKSGRDKRFYKTCPGPDVRLSCSYEKGQIEVSVFGETMSHPLVRGHNDVTCPEKTSLLLIGLNNLSTGESRLSRLSGITLFED